MQHLLEILLTKFVDQKILFHRTELDISQQSDNPDELVLLAVQKFSPQIINRQRLISHSTSWRYVEGGKTIITYVVYSDDFVFDEKEISNLDFSAIKIIESGDASKPSPNNIQIENVVSHGIRHLAFLVVNNPGLYSSVINPASYSSFQEIDQSLAGKI